MGSNGTPLLRFQEKLTRSGLISQFSLFKYPYFSCSHIAVEPHCGRLEPFCKGRQVQIVILPSKVAGKITSCQSYDSNSSLGQPAQRDTTTYLVWICTTVKVLT